MIATSIFLGIIAGWLTSTAAHGSQVVLSGNVCRESCLCENTTSSVTLPGLDTQVCLPLEQEGNGCACYSDLAGHLNFPMCFKDERFCNSGLQSNSTCDFDIQCGSL